MTPLSASLADLTSLPGAPRAYARSRFGKNVEAWMRRKGWLDRRRVERLAETPEVQVAREEI